MYKLLIFFIVFLPSYALALTPIAHVDVVPRQRIEYGTSFNFGVVAFCKTGIEKVDFVISGQGYSGGTKTATSMALNTRVASTTPGTVYNGVYEYFVTISSSEFTSNGLITVTPTVHDNGSTDTKVLSAVTLYVEGASDESQTTAYVNIDNPSGSPALNDSENPYGSIEAAMNAIDTANGDLDYSIIYLTEDTYDTNNRSSGTTDTTAEWVTIKAAPGANINNVIIAADGTLWDTTYIKMEGLTLYRSGHSNRALDTSGSWVNGCRIIGNAEATGPPWSSDNPLANAAYITSSYTYNVSFGVIGTAIDIYRGNVLTHSFDDFSQNKEDVLYVNLDISDIWGDVNQPTDGWHADLFQIYWDQCDGTHWDNIIFYNVIATNLQYGSLFLNGWGSMGNANTNIAFVNTFGEFRNPNVSGNRTYMYDYFDHFLMWHCTFSISDATPATGCSPTPCWGLYQLNYGDSCDPDTPQYYENASFIGNILYAFTVNNGTQGLTYLDSGNGYGNEAKYNHYEVTSTDPGENYTTGRTVLNWDTPGSSYYGRPIINSDAYRTVAQSLTGVPCDATGKQRTLLTDMGAFQLGGVSSSVGAGTQNKVGPGTANTLNGL